MEEDSKEVSNLKAASNSNRKSIPAGRVEDKADKEPTKTLRRRKEKTRLLASCKKSISALNRDRKPENKTTMVRLVTNSSLKDPKTG